MPKKSYAKINLSLDVINKRDDGYHNLKMIMQTVSLYDTITVEKSDDISISCTNPNVPCDETNIVYKCAKKLLDIKGKSYGFKIHIEKNIPMAAGLAGGSSDGAQVLKEINRIYELGFSMDELKRIGATIGADIPYCLEGGTYLCEGIGDMLTKTDDFEYDHILLVKPPIDVSTPWVYKNLKLDEILSHPNTEKVIKCLKECDVSGLKDCSGNLLESVTEKEYPQIAHIKEKMYSFGASFSMMSGSGPTVFGIFENETDINCACDYFRAIYPDTFKVKTVNKV